MAKIVEMHNIMKRFQHVQAVDNGFFDLERGEVHSLIGENGAGKSTMMKMLYGLYQADSGTIHVNGKEVPKGYNTFDAIDLEIGMVHQEFMLTKEMTVLENIIVGSEPTKKKLLIDTDKAKEIINQYIENHHMNVQLDKKVVNISVGEAQRVEIIKALYRGAKILILDEPTAVLTPQESDKLFEIIEMLKKDGRSIVFISHKLKEVMKISDRITVMRGGKFIDTVNKADTSIPELAKMMVGREVFCNMRHEHSKVGDVVLKVENLVAPADRELSKLKGISFEVRAGEILGVAGVDGNGQAELGNVLAGFAKPDAGRIWIDGVEVTGKKSGFIRRSGLTHIPEDRNVRGLNKALDIKNNLVSYEIGKAPYSRHGIIQKNAIIEMAKKRIAKYDIRPANGDVMVGSLSGGNAQKVIVARELDLEGKVLLANQPTRGVDIGAIESIRTLIGSATDAGKAVLLISADLDEILSLADRIIVMYEGQITGEVVNDGNVDELELGLMMTGGKKND